MKLRSGESFCCISKYVGYFPNKVGITFKDMVKFLYVKEYEPAKEKSNIP